MLARLSGQTPWQVTCPTDLYILRFQKADFLWKWKEKPELQEAGSTEDVPACFSFGIVFFINAAIWRNNTMEFFNQAITVLQTLVVAIGAGLGVWGVVNLMEGYGNDNPGANAHVR